VAKLLGKVIDFRVAGGQLIERVQWAVDVAECELAQLGFKLTQAGYLKAVSVGFFPVQYLTPNSGQAWTDALAEMKLTADADVRAIYTVQEQVELSACVLGANPNALAKARSDGLILDDHLEKFPQLQRRIEKGRGSDRLVFSFPTATATKSVSQEHFMKQINVFIRDSGTSTPKEAFDGLEMLRRNGGTEDEISHALTGVRRAVSAERREADPSAAYLRQPGRREFWNALARYVARRVTGAEGPKEQAEVFKALDLEPGGSGVAMFLGQALSQDIMDLLAIYGAHRTLGYHEAEKQITKFAKVTGRPDAWFISPTQGDIGAPADVSSAGSQLLPSMNILASLLNVALGLVEDPAVDLSAALVRTFTQGLASRIDWACFQGSGVVDASNGGQLGLFTDPAVASFASTTGAPGVGQLGRADFLGAVGLVASAALQRPCQWHINPVFLPTLLQLTEGNGAQFVVKTPAETGDGTWRIVGFPIVFTAQAPAVDGPGNKVALFGHGEGYLVAVRNAFEMDASRHAAWNSSYVVYRAIGRVFCQMREATAFATLKIGPR
jgi:HK97 family phage major capsid protein